MLYHIIIETFNCVSLVLLDLQADKEIDRTYNKIDYINNRIKEKGMVVINNTVIVDDGNLQLIEVYQK